MKGFEDLTEAQRDALTDAFGNPDEYGNTNLSRIEDPIDAAGYEVFRESLEGQTVSRGEMEQQKIDSYKNIGFLREGEEGLEINSLWDDWQVKALQKNGMYDFEEPEIYVSEQSEKPQITFVHINDEAKIEIENSLTYPVDEVSSDAAEDKLRELSNDFVVFFTEEESEERDDENNTSSSKPDDSNDTGGDNDMTDDEEYDVPMTAAHAVAYESRKNLDEHEEVVDDELYNLDVDEQVALGTAGVLKGMEESEYGDIGTAELAEFIDDYGDAFEGDAFLRYKGQMGGDQYDEDIPGNVADVVDDTNDIKQALEADTLVWEALYREKAADNEESQEVIEGMLNEVSRLDREDSRLRASRQGLQIAENTERRQSQKADDIDDLARNL